jgi:manganese/iron transport system ATP-binding protein
MTDPATVLTYRGVSVGYRGVPVLTGVDLTVPPGGRLALAGPNGAGKSTLIRSMVGLAEVLGGAARIFGRAPAESRSLCGYVPQLGDLDADFPVTAGQVVLMGRYRRIGWFRPTGAADRRAARDALARVGLTAEAGKRFGLLSGGQRQRVVVSQETILTVLRELSTGPTGAAGTAIVLSTHDLGLARDFADQVCLVNGRQWAVGAPAEVLTAGPLKQAYGGHAVDLTDGSVLVEP